MRFQSRRRRRGPLLQSLWRSFRNRQNDWASIQQGILLGQVSVRIQPPQPQEKAMKGISSALGGRDPVQAQCATDCESLRQGFGVGTKGRHRRPLSANCRSLAPCSASGAPTGVRVGHARAQSGGASEASQGREEIHECAGPRKDGRCSRTSGRRGCSSPSCSRRSVVFAEGKLSRSSGGTSTSRMRRWRFAKASNRRRRAFAEKRRRAVGRAI